MPEYTLEIVAIATVVFLIACSFYTLYLFLSKAFGNKEQVSDLDRQSIDHLQDRVKELESCLKTVSMLILKSDDRHLLGNPDPTPKRRIIKGNMNPEVRNIKKRMGRPPRKQPVEVQEK